MVYLRPSPGAVGGLIDFELSVITNVAPSPDFALVGAINPPNVGVSAPVIEAVSATTFVFIVSLSIFCNLRLDLIFLVLLSLLLPLVLMYIKRWGLIHQLV